jgi:hypothetical protein
MHAHVLAKVTKFAGFCQISVCLVQSEFSKTDKFQANSLKFQENQRIQPPPIFFLYRPNFLTLLGVLASTR